LKWIENYRGGGGGGMGYPSVVVKSFDITHTKPYFLVLPFDSLSHHLLFHFWLLEKILFYQLAGRKRMKTIG
jgi:hypothetical protein